MKTLATIVAVLMLSQPAQAAISCRSAPIKYGSWRLIDGKRCWYPGVRMVDKAQLRWSNPRPSQRAGRTRHRLVYAQIRFRPRAHRQREPEPETVVAEDVIPMPRPRPRFAEPPPLPHYLTPFEQRFWGDR